MAGDGDGGRGERPSRIQLFVERISLGRAVAAVIVTAIALTILGAVLLRLVNPDEFHTFGQASWLALITVTTVGYGDVTPTNTAGRVVAGALALLGISLIPALTSLVVSVLITKRSKVDESRRQQDQQEVLGALEQIERRLEGLETSER